MLLPCLLSLCLDLELAAGATYAGAPPDGTWWQSPYPHHFHLNSFDWQAGVGGSLPTLLGMESRWSIEYADLGLQSSTAIACAAGGALCPPHPLSHWNAQQHPHGIWGAWEPTLWRPLFAQLGGGYFNDRFRVDIPDYPFPNGVGGFSPVHAAAGSGVGWHPSYIAGLGLRWRLFDAIISNRFIHTPNANSGHGSANPASNGIFDFTGQYENLSHSAWTFVLRARI